MTSGLAVVMGALTSLASVLDNNPLVSILTIFVGVLLGCAAVIAMDLYGRRAQRKEPRRRGP